MKAAQPGSCTMMESDLDAGECPSTLSPAHSIHSCWVRHYVGEFPSIIPVVQSIHSSCLKQSAVPVFFLLLTIHFCWVRHYDKECPSILSPAHSIHSCWVRHYAGEWPSKLIHAHSIVIRIS